MEKIKIVLCKIFLTANCIPVSIFLLLACLLAILIYELIKAIFGNNDPAHPQKLENGVRLKVLPLCIGLTSLVIAPSLTVIIHYLKLSREVLIILLFLFFATTLQRALMWHSDWAASRYPVADNPIQRAKFKLIRNAYSLFFWNLSAILGAIAALLTYDKFFYAFFR